MYLRTRNGKKFVLVVDLVLMADGEIARFDPSRWLSADFVNSDATKASFIPWGAGSRVCIGMHLASMELRLGAALFFRECRDATLAPSTTDESMVPANLFLISPQAKRCDVVIPS